MKSKLTVTIVCCVMTMMSFAQQKLTKSSKSINATKDVTIDLNTNYVEIEVDTWSKNTVEIEAYIESEKLSKEELQDLLKEWNLEISGSGDYISISSKGGHGFPHLAGDYAHALRDLELRLADLPEIPEMPAMPKMPKMPKIDIPEMPEMPELPELPEGVKSVNFDYEKYKEQGDAYLEKWSAEYEAKYGKEYKEKMKEWARKFEASGYQEKMQKWGEEFGKKFEGKWAKDMEKWGEEFGKDFGEEWAKKMEKWGEEFGESFGKDFEKRMEAWGERYGKQMERQAELMERHAERMTERQAARAEREAALAERYAERSEALAERREAQMLRKKEMLENRLESKAGVKKVIKIKMPKKAKLKMNVRHGELKMSSVIHDAKGDIQYASVIADYIDGSDTSINVSYSPVLIKNWNLGTLTLNYVDDADIGAVQRINLNSKSSNVSIGAIMGSAIVNGSFGKLGVDSIADSFYNLNVVLENSDALLALPTNGDYNLQFTGNRSRLSHPKKGKSVSVNTFTDGNMSSNKSIIVNAKFSTVSMQ